jgi:hypothetical protein
VFEAMTYIAATASPSSDQLVSTLITWGPGGVVLALIIFGVLDTKRPREMAEADRDSWKEAFVKEQDAHQKTREALARAEERSEAATEAASTTAALLEELGHRRTKQQRGPQR